MYHNRSSYVLPQEGVLAGFDPLVADLAVLLRAHFPKPLLLAPGVIDVIGAKAVMPNAIVRKVSRAGLEAIPRLRDLADGAKRLKLLVAGEGFEPPTHGL